MADHLIFEAVQAHAGDCLLVRYGQPERPRLVIIDGGPGDTYEVWLRPRLEQIRGDTGGPLHVEMVMVSHIDDDHIKGIVDLCEDLLASGDKPLVAVESLWHNSFADLTGIEIGAEGLPEANTFEAASPELRSIRYSVPQGQMLRHLATQLGFGLNAGNDLITDAMERVCLPGGLRLTVLAPNKTRIEQLREEWHKERLDGRALAPSTEQTVSNLSSMVVLIEYGTRRILLTGDAHQDDILDGLATHGFLDDSGRIYLDVLKIPHHGSDKNVSTGFFRAVTADHYVVSGDGKNDNPEVATIEMVADARGNDRYTLWLTNDEHRLARVLQDRGRRTVKIRAKKALSVELALDGR